MTFLDSWIRHTSGESVQRCNLRFSKGQIKLTCKDYGFILRCFLQIHPHRLAAQTFLWVRVYWTMSHTAVQQPHWYKGIRRCYENRRGKKTTSFETDGFKEASQAESNYILLWSAWGGKKKVKICLLQLTTMARQCQCFTSGFPQSAAAASLDQALYDWCNPIDEAARFNHTRGARW